MRDLSDDRNITRFLADRSVDALRRIQVLKESARAERISPGEQLDSIQRQNLFAKPA
jgi:hypothetical protein